MDVNSRFALLVFQPLVYHFRVCVTTDLFARLVDDRDPQRNRLIDPTKQRKFVIPSIEELEVVARSRLGIDELLEGVRSWNATCLLFFFVHCELSIPTQMDLMRSSGSLNRAVTEIQISTHGGGLYVVKLCTLASVQQMKVGFVRLASHFST